MCSCLIDANIVHNEAGCVLHILVGMSGGHWGVQVSCAHGDFTAYLVTALQLCPVRQLDAYLTMSRYGVIVGVMCHMPGILKLLCSGPTRHSSRSCRVVVSVAVPPSQRVRCCCAAAAYCTRRLSFMQLLVRDLLTTCFQLKVCVVLDM